MDTAVVFRVQLDRRTTGNEKGTPGHGQGYKATKEGNTFHGGYYV